VRHGEEVRGDPRPRLLAFLSSYQQDGLHATEGPAATSACPCSRQQSRGIGASPRKRLSGQLCSRPLKPALLSPRKLVSPDLWPMSHAKSRGIRSPLSPPSLRRLLPTYCPLVPSTSNGARGQVQRVRDEKFPSGCSF